MKKEEYINTVISYMVDKTQIKLVQREISDHILDRIDYYRHCGYSDETSEQKALEHMGDARELGIKMNYLYDNSKLNIVSLILLIMTGTTVLSYIVSYVLTINFPFGIDGLYGGFWDGLVAFTFYISDSLIFLLSSLIFWFSVKSKNYKHLIALGSLNTIYIFEYLLKSFSSGAYNYKNYAYLSYSVGEIIEGLSQKAFVFYSGIIVPILIVTFLFTVILSFAYGLYLKLVINGKSKTCLDNRYYKLRMVPFIINITAQFSSVVFVTLSLLGVFM